MLPASGCSKPAIIRKRGGLAAARRTEQGQELARRHVQMHVPRRVNLALDAVREALRHAVDLDADGFDRHCSQPPNMLVTGITPGARNQRSPRPIRAITTNTMTTTSTEYAAAGPSDSSVMFSRIFTVISVQLIDTRKIVALIAVIDRMKTTPRPGEECRQDQRQRHAAKRRAAASAQALRCLLETLVDLLQHRDRGADAGGAVAEDITRYDDQRRAGELDRRIVERDQVSDADDRARQRVVDHRHELHRAPSDERACCATR